MPVARGSSCQWAYAATLFATMLAVTLVDARLLLGLTSGEQGRSAQRSRHLAGLDPTDAGQASQQSAIYHGLHYGAVLLPEDPQASSEPPPSPASGTVNTTATRNTSIVVNTTVRLLQDRCTSFSAQVYNCCARFSDYVCLCPLINLACVVPGGV